MDRIDFMGLRSSDIARHFDGSRNGTSGEDVYKLYKHGDHISYPFNTAPVSRDPCLEPFVYYLTSGVYDRRTNQTRTEYVQFKTRMSECKWRMANPARIRKVVVLKSRDPNLWDQGSLKSEDLTTVRETEDDSDVLIECRDVYKSFGEKHILRGVSFKSPRRNCCRVNRENRKKKGSTMVIEVGVCHHDEVVEVS